MAKRSGWQVYKDRPADRTVECGLDRWARNWLSPDDEIQISNRLSIKPRTGCGGFVLSQWWLMSSTHNFMIMRCNLTWGDRRLFLPSFLILLNWSSSLQWTRAVGQDDLHVTRRCHVRVDTTVRPVGSSSHLGCSIDLYVANIQLFNIQTLEVGICLGVTE